MPGPALIREFCTAIAERKKVFIVVFSRSKTYYKPLGSPQPVRDSQHFSIRSLTRHFSLKVVNRLGTFCVTCHVIQEAVTIRQCEKHRPLKQTQVMCLVYIRRLEQEPLTKSVACYRQIGMFLTSHNHLFPSFSNYSN